MTRRSLAVVTAGLSQPSATRLLADRLAAATVAAAGDVEVDLRVIELRDLAHDITDNLLTGFPPAPLRAALDTVASADGLIAVTPVFSASYSGLFKSFFDVVDREALAGKPVLLGATGGTARHSLALDYAMRPLFAYLRALPVPTSVFAAAEDWGSDAAEAPLRSRIDRAAAELATELARRTPTPPHDPFALTASFEDLLAR